MNILEVSNILKVRKGIKQNHNQSALKAGRAFFLKGNLLILVLIIGASVWLSPSQVGMTDTPITDTVLREADPPDPDFVLRAGDPPTEADPPDPDFVLRAGDPPTEADPPDPDKVFEADPPDPDVAP